MTDIVGVDVSELRQALEHFRRKGGALSQVTPIIAEMLVTAVSDVFEAEGPGWEPLVVSTLMARRAGGAGAKILQDTGAMAGSVSPGSGSDWAEAFAGVSYAVFHARGTIKMPRRDPFELGPFEQDVLDDVADLLLEHVTT